MALRDWSEFSKPPLEFPINGKTYTVPKPDIPTGVKLNAVISGEDEAFAKLPPAELWKLVLGPVWDELVADGVTLEAAARVGLTALADFQYDREMAEAAWEKGADPKAMAAYLQRGTSRASRRSTSTASATKTPSPVSTKATTSRKS